jgi:hypothetical protein
MRDWRLVALSNSKREWIALHADVIGAMRVKKETTEQRKRKPPLHANGYDGTPLTPYSSFGKTGEHNGILMTENLAKAIFNVAMMHREPYMQRRSFQSVYGKGLPADGTYKFSNQVFVNTSGHSLVQPFGRSQTMMSKQGLVIVSQLKYTNARYH